MKNLSKVKKCFAERRVEELNAEVTSEHFLTQVGAPGEQAVERVGALGFQMPPGISLPSVDPKH